MLCSFLQLYPLLQDYTSYLDGDRCPAGVGDYLFKKQSLWKESGRDDTEHFLSNISYTRFCIHFVPFSSPAVARFRAAGAWICIRLSLVEKNCDHRCEENSDSNGGREAWHSRHGVCVCQFVSSLSLARQPRQRRPSTHTSTRPSISQSSPQVWQTETYPSCLQIASGENAPWRTTSNDKSKLETAHSTEKSIHHLQMAYISEYIWLI